MTSEPITKEEREPTLREVVAFLIGAGELDGCWFGEYPEGKPVYWWRSRLRAALTASEAEVARLKEALRPFAPLVDMDFDDQQATVLEVLRGKKRDLIPGPCWGDFRRARQALAGETDDAR